MLALLLHRMHRTNRIAHFFLFAFGFFATWGTVWMLRPGVLGGVPWPLATIGVHVGDVVLLVGAVFGIVCAWRLRPKRFIAACVIIGIAMVGNIAVSFDPALTAMGWVRLAAFMLFLAGLPYSSEATRAFLNGFLLAMFGHTLLGIAQFFTFEGDASTLLGIAHHNAWTLGDAVVLGWDGRWLRAYGGFPHPNVFGAALLIALMVSASMPRERSRRMRILDIGYWALGIFALTLTFSRAAWLGFVALLCILVMRRASRSLAVSGAIAFVVFLFVFAPLVMPRATGSGRLEERSTGERRSSMSDAFTLTAMAPLLGVGLHAMPHALAALDPARDPYTAQPAHNAPLLAFVEVGVLGIFALLIATALLIPKRSLVIGHWSLVIPLIPPLLLDHYLWSLPIGLALLLFAFGSILGLRALRNLLGWGYDIPHGALG